MEYYHGIKMEDIAKASPEALLESLKIAGFFDELDVKTRSFKDFSMDDAIDVSLEAMEKIKTDLKDKHLIEINDEEENFIYERIWDGLTWISNGYYGNYN
jgi:hypothetical protein